MKNIFSILLIVLAINLSLADPLFAAQTTDKNAARIKTKVLKINSRTKKNIFVKFNDGSKLKGILADVADENFDVVDGKTGKPVNIEFARVKKVSDGGGLSTGTKIIIGSVAAGAAVLIILAIGFSTLD